VVCPWHGHEYLPDSGASRPPLTEKVATFAVPVVRAVCWSIHDRARRVRASSRRESHDRITPIDARYFYIEYSGEMPRAIGRRVRMAGTIVAAVAAVAVVVVVVAPTRLPPSPFEFGVVTDRTGILQRTTIRRSTSVAAACCLSGRKKEGRSALTGIANGPVTIRGSRIQRGNRALLEVLDARPATISAKGDAHKRETAPIATLVTRRGEIVDSQCFLGVMNPGEGLFIVIAPTADSSFVAAMVTRCASPPANTSQPRRSFPCNRVRTRASK
jgi:hypothetical protein